MWEVKSFRCPSQRPRLWAPPCVTVGGHYFVMAVRHTRDSVNRTGFFLFSIFFYDRMSRSPDGQDDSRLRDQQRLHHIIAERKLRWCALSRVLLLLLRLSTFKWIIYAPQTHVRRACSSIVRRKFFFFQIIIVYYCLFFSMRVTNNYTSTYPTERERTVISHRVTGAAKTYKNTTFLRVSSAALSARCNYSFPTKRSQRG